MGVPYTVTIKMLACARQARCGRCTVAAAIKHARILAQDGWPHRRRAAATATTTAAGHAPAQAGELSYDDSRDRKKFTGNAEKFEELSN
ncbi:hypothetical protein [Janthinobacterium sp. 1_2014MBL_MicDiv]|uniref:hypothetical protein n=1 Tax=Janthinobacterium sp. 1_2014MBL_MicDiv TaxID=1644131 RepID=UPI0012EBAFEB|nr:hypothetical protein [Janthinobacterium sp. 1_2014MBL_MicDiv]MDN2708654.1 hypothetical protein [Janthinobacterium sp. SUN118]